MPYDDFEHTLPMSCTIDDDVLMNMTKHVHVHLNDVDV